MTAPYTVGDLVAELLKHDQTRVLCMTAYDECDGVSGEVDKAHVELHSAYNAGAGHESVPGLRLVVTLS